MGEIDPNLIPHLGTELSNTCLSNQQQINTTKHPKKPHRFFLFLSNKQQKHPQTINKESNTLLVPKKQTSINCL